MKTFTLEITTQEKHLLTETVNSLTVVTESGEITVLPDHVPLFTRLKPGELTYVHNSKATHFAISGGFLDISPTNVVTVLADSALRSDQINLAKAEEAIVNAQKALKESADLKDTLKIEMELRNALLQANVARKRQNQHG